MWRAVRYAKMLPLLTSNKTQTYHIIPWFGWFDIWCFLLLPAWARYRPCMWCLSCVKCKVRVFMVCRIVKCKSCPFDSAKSMKHAADDTKLHMSSFQTLVWQGTKPKDFLTKRLHTRVVVLKWILMDVYVWKDVNKTTNQNWASVYRRSLLTGLRI